MRLLVGALLLVCFNTKFSFLYSKFLLAGLLGFEGAGSCRILT